MGEEREVEERKRKGLGERKGKRKGALCSIFCKTYTTSKQLDLLLVFVLQYRTVWMKAKQIVKAVHVYWFSSF